MRFGEKGNSVRGTKGVPSIVVSGSVVFFVLRLRRGRETSDGLVMRHVRRGLRTGANMAVVILLF